jgi:hypothetical protein
MKTFYNSKDALNYLKTKAKEGEEIKLIENATFFNPKRTYNFKKDRKSSEDK